MLKGLHELSITSYSSSSCANPTIKKKGCDVKLSLISFCFCYSFLLHLHIIFFCSFPFSFVFFFLMFCFFFFCSFVSSFCIPSDFSILSHVILFYFYFLSPSLYCSLCVYPSLCLPSLCPSIFVSTRLS